MNHVSYNYGLLPCPTTESDGESGRYGNRQTLTSPSDSVSCLMRTAHARFLSDTTHCLIVTSRSVCRETVPDIGSGPVEAPSNAALHCTKTLGGFLRAKAEGQRPSSSLRSTRAGALPFPSLLECCRVRNHTQALRFRRLWVVSDGTGWRLRGSVTC